jgi:putative aldouronate transport system permease protein
MKFYRFSLTPAHFTDNFISYRETFHAHLEGEGEELMRTTRQKSLRRRIWAYKELYLLLLPALVLLLIFNYAPMYGLQIAFRNFRASAGIWRSEWVGLRWFQRFFGSYNSARMILNTVLLSLELIVFTFPVPILLALLLNHVQYHQYRRIVQTVLYAPHFISVMVLAGMLRIFLSPSDGLVNLMLQATGNESIYFLGNPRYFRAIYILSDIWQHSGWDTIIYIAALSGVDTQLYDAAKVDGAGTFRRIWHVDLPAITPTIVIMLIMRFGGLMNIGFEKAYLLQTPLNKDASEIIATYVYEQGILRSQYSFSAAVGLFNTMVNITLLLVVNRIAKKVSNISFI